MAQKINQRTIAKQLDDGVSVKLGEPGTGVVSIQDQMVTVRRARLTLSGLSVAVTAAADYGGTKLLDLPDSNIVILGADVNLTATKGGTTNGIVAATDVNIGVGTATASNATLSSTMQNLVNVFAVTTDALEVAVDRHSADNSSPAPLVLPNGASNALFLNVAAAITANDTIAFSGTIDLFYVDLGAQSN